MARSLAFKNVQRAISTSEPNASDLTPGYMRLYQNYQPILAPGHYGIEVKQNISSTGPLGTDTLEEFNYDSTTVVGNTPPTTVLPQKFDVIVPQFSLDPKIINSYYPPDGHADESRVLPHIVFNDPHIPWDRPYQSVVPDLVVAAPTTSSAPALRPTPVPTPALPDFPNLFPPADAPDVTNPGSSTSPATSLVPGNRGHRYPYIPPWFALVVFDPSELAITKDDAASLNIPGYNNDASFASTPLPSSGAFEMTVGDYLTKISSRVNYQYGNPDFAQLQTSTDPTKIIFPLKIRARELFGISLKFLFMCHVREVNTTGFPDAGVEETGLFSICVSHVTGPATDKPVTQIVHLVSIENFDHTIFDGPGPSDRMGMVSLFSWTYLAVPKSPINFKDTMKALATTKQMLSPPVSTLTAIRGDTSIPALKPAAQHLYDRLSLGYSIGRWRTATGEESVAFFRGPLTPVITPWKPSTNNDWPDSSNTGKDFQILDQDLGVMDMTYSSAWQLGKLLAIQDTVFNSALLRFRSLVHQTAASQTRMLLNNVVSKASIIKKVGNTVSGIHDTQQPDKVPVRNILPSADKVAPPFSDPSVSPIFSRTMAQAVDAQTYTGQALYNDYNLGAANNSDWEIIHKWIGDKLFLSGIPAHYLTTDPTHLPSEALRFFYIDASWLDCFIDGALSVANHLEPVDDKVRRRIKDVYNVYLRNNIQPLPTKPPVPRYGFILRSALIKVMPDIRITVQCRKEVGKNIYIPDSSRAPLVRLTKLDENTIFALLDCFPEEIHHIRLAQPPHQQRFVAAQDLGPPQVHTIKKLYSEGAPAPSDFGVGWDDLPIPATIDPTLWYQPTIRCLNIFQMASDLYKILPFSTSATQYFLPRGMDSTIFALELNDNNYQIDFLPPDGSSLATVPTQDRQLWVGVDVNDDNDPIPPATVPPPVVIGPPIVISPVPQPPPTTTGSSIILPPILRPPPAPAAAKLSIHPPSSIKQNLTASLPLNLSQNPILVKDITPATPILTTAPRYLVTIHPSYRLTPPLPSMPSAGPPPTSPIYSPQDFIPTGTAHLINLIFSLKLQPAVASVPPPTPTPMLVPGASAPTPAVSTPAAATPTPTPAIIPIPIPVLIHPLRLSSLTITIPLTSPTPTTTAPEPLLNAPTTTTLPLTAKMIHNKRLTPLLTTSSAPSTLIITLRPRSATPPFTSSASLLLANVAEAGFQLSNCDIATIQRLVPVDVFGWGKLARGLCKVGVVEEYVELNGPGGSVGQVFTASSEVVVVKRDGGDRDAAGNAV